MRQKGFSIDIFEDFRWDFPAVNVLIHKMPLFFRIVNLLAFHKFIRSFNAPFQNLMLWLCAKYKFKRME